MLVLVLLWSVLSVVRLLLSKRVCYIIRCTSSAVCGTFEIKAASHIANAYGMNIWSLRSYSVLLSQRAMTTKQLPSLSAAAAL